MIFPNHRSSSGVPFLSPQNTKDLQRQALLGQVTRGFFHDLLSPLAALQLYMGHMQNLVIDKAYASIAEDIHAELSAFITTIQFNLNNPGVTNKACFYDLCVTASTLLKSKLTARNVRLVIVGDKELTLMTQPLYLIQILTNGLSNAIDAFDTSPQDERKTVTLSYERTRNNLVITIQDTGEGIPQALQKDIFNLYTSTKKDGHGIGLATTKNIVTEVFHGIISLVSEEGIGTTLTVDLPMDHQSSEYPDHSNQDQRS